MIPLGDTNNSILSGDLTRTTGGATYQYHSMAGGDSQKKMLSKLKTMKRKKSKKSKESKESKKSSKTTRRRYSAKKIKTKTHIYFNKTTPEIDDIKMLLTRANFDVYPNDEDENKNNTYKNAMGLIQSKVENDFLCEGLSKDYITGSFEKVDAIVAVGSPGDLLPNGSVFGFALIQFIDKTNSIYIDVICSHIGIKYGGEILMKEIDNICKALFMTQIRLRSVDSAISFYKKYGFSKCDDLCKDMCLMIKNIDENTGGNPKKPRHYKKSRTSRNNK